MKILKLACYINSVVQCLFMTKSFREHILKNNFPTNCFYVSSLKDLFVRLDENKEKWLDPLNYVERLPLPFNSTRDQQDITEFCKMYTDVLENELKDNKLPVPFTLHRVLSTQCYSPR